MAGCTAQVHATCQASSGPGHTESVVPSQGQRNASAPETHTFRARILRSNRLERINTVPLHVSRSSLKCVFKLRNADATPAQNEASCFHSTSRVTHPLQRLLPGNADWSYPQRNPATRQRSVPSRVFTKMTRRQNFDATPGTDWTVF